MKKSITLVLCLFVLSVIGGPVKSILSSRCIIGLDTPQPNPNPYVTDGLVAMFDGEWNSGDFEHNPDLDGWIDLVNGVKASETGYAGTYEITEKSYVFDMPTGSGGYGLLKASFIPELAKSVRHIECVYRINDSSILFGALCLCGPTDRQFVCSKCGSGLMAQIGYSQYGRLIDESADSYHTYSISMTGGWPLLNAAYQDGISLDISSYMSGFTHYQPYEEGRLYIPFKHWDRSIIEISIIRLYNRNLMPQEVLHNHLVDRERFGF